MAMAMTMGGEVKERREDVRRSGRSVSPMQVQVVALFIVCICVCLLCEFSSGACAASVEYEWPMPTPLPYNASYGTSSLLYDSKMATNIVKLRRQLHATPGVMYDEYEAAALVTKTLRGMGIKDYNIQNNVGITGVIAHIGFGTLRSSSDTDSVPTILLRADMDALPIHEETDVPFRSQVDGVMHACGHDAHTAMLLGAAMALKAAEGELVRMRAAVRLFFQPAEEGGAGAKAMIDEGAMAGADAAVMLHVSNLFDVGVFAAKRGIVNAACSKFDVVVKGVGAHGANPHQSKDPIAAAGAIISGIHQIVSRVVDPVDSVVISIGYVNGGKAFNVIPDEVTLGGTIRLTDMAVFDTVFETLRLRVEGIARAYGCSAVLINGDGEKGVNSRGVEFTKRAFPVNINDDAMIDLGIKTATKLFGEENAQLYSTMSMGCEDFSFVSQKVPAVQFRIGTKHPNHAIGEKTGSPAHNPLFDIDERALVRGSAFMSTIALSWAKNITDSMPRPEPQSRVPLDNEL